jgi:hypothetical protein
MLVGPRIIPTDFFMASEFVDEMMFIREDGYPASGFRCGRKETGDQFRI